MQKINRALKEGITYICNSEWNGILDKVVREDLSRNMTFKQRIKRLAQAHWSWEERK